MTKSYPPLDYKEEVTVIGLAEEPPANAIEIGKVEIGDTGFTTNCGWDIVTEKAKAEARKAGGNVIKIIEHRPPSVMGSSCDRIKALILKVENTEELTRITESRYAIADSTWEYAKLYVYRPGGAGALIGYDLYLGDQLLCRVKNNSTHEIKLTREGKGTLWATTETKSEVPIDIEFGREYYLRCSIVMGIAVGRPKLQLVEKIQGKPEYDKIKNR